MQRAHTVQNGRYQIRCVTDNNRSYIKLIDEMPCHLKDILFIMDSIISVSNISNTSNKFSESTRVIGFHAFRGSLDGDDLGPELDAHKNSLENVSSEE